MDARRHAKDQVAYSDVDYLYLYYDVYLARVASSPGFGRRTDFKLLTFGNARTLAPGIQLFNVGFLCKDFQNNKRGFPTTLPD